MPNGISTIRDFYKVAQDRDFARKNQLRVLSINSGAGLTVDFTTDDLVYVKAAKLPSRKITTSAATYMGLKFNIPGNVEYEGSEAYEVTFFADQKFELWDKFQEWTRQVFDDESSTGNYFTPKASATITLLVLDNELNPVKKINLIGTVCLNVGELEYTIDDAGTIQEFPVTFSYHFWTDENL
tara:strand:- start:33389 stop:33937 length:549 start_codon:yes stop_codon:yes gene_type:complete